VKIYFDTAVLVAASVANHPHYVESAGALRTARLKKIQAYVSGHGLAEFYAVLTRTPFTPPVYPSEAWQLLSQNILPYFEIVILSGKEYEDTIRKCVEQGWAGGRLYDALHIRCALKVPCDRIYTLNIRHFQQLAPECPERITTPQAHFATG
jgi:predicted nucleic acid-binding protein